MDYANASLDPSQVVYQSSGVPREVSCFSFSEEVTYPLLVTSVFKIQESDVTLVYSSKRNNHVIVL